MKQKSFSKKKTLFGILTTVALILVLNVHALAAHVILQGWDLVDSGKHLDYDGNSRYMSQITTGASTWNGYKSGVIRKDSASVVEDVYITDIDIVNGNTGITYSNGKIEMNYYYLKDSTANGRINTATHELGHALGLDHSLAGDIMYNSQTEQTTLGADDKVSYDGAYLRY